MRVSRSLKIVLLAVSSCLVAPPVLAQDASSTAVSCSTNVSAGIETCWESQEAVAGRGTTSPDATEARVAEVEAMTSEVVIGIFYYGTNKTGTSIVYTATSGCDNDTGVEWSIGVLNSTNNNQFESGQGYSQCGIKVYENFNFAGASVGFGPSYDTFGLLNNQVSSIKFR